MPPSARPIEQRFAECISITNSCWNWLGPRNKLGYGQVFVAKRDRRILGGKRLIRATHLSLFIAHRPVTPGMLVRHTCDNPNCVRPDHLIEGTQADNVSDMVTRGRQRRGERKPLAKLTDSIVRSMRERHANGESAAFLAISNGVNKVTGWNAIVGKTWRHVK